MKINNEKILKIWKLAGRSTLIILASIVASYALISQINKTSLSIQEKRALKSTLEQRITSIAKMRDDLNKIGEENYNKIDNALPTTDNVSDFITIFDNLAARYSLKQNSSLGSLAPANIASHDGSQIYTMDYNISMSANIDSLINYIKGFEKLPFLPAIHGIDITSQSSAQGWRSNSSIFLKGKLHVKQS